MKYETPYRQPNRLDVPPGVGPLLDDPAVPLWITEGTRKADSAANLGLACISLSGVDCWHGTNPDGGKTALPDWADVALNGRRVVLAFDGDVARKPAVRGALNRLASWLTSARDAKVEYLWLPDGESKVGLDDYIAAGHGPDELWALVHPDLPPVAEQQEMPEAPPEPPAPEPERRTLDEAHAVFRRWFGAEYDLDALDVVLATAAVEQLDGDPAWLLVISGSGNAKTETVMALRGVRAHVVSTITGEAALLSGTPEHEKSKKATGGLLVEIGARGVLVIKDVTSILSMSRDRRDQVLAALREVADGWWNRKVGTEGGLSLTWSGRIVTVGAVTTAWDTAHGAIAKLGDRFALVRVDSTKGRSAAGRQALRNVGAETRMRAELAAVVGGLLRTVRLELATLADEDADDLLAAADLVTYARTAVERDYRSDVVDAHAPEAPTRFAKMLGQIARGGLALGMDRDNALKLALRVARDSIPPLRLTLLVDVMNNPGTTTSDATGRAQKPRTTVDRALQELHLLGLLAVEGSDEVSALIGRRAGATR